MGCLQRNESGVWSRTTAGDEEKKSLDGGEVVLEDTGRGTRDFYGLEERPPSQSVTQRSKRKKRGSVSSDEANEIEQTIIHKP